MMFFSCAGQRPENLGIQNDQLTGCPGKPNCVSSQDEDENHFLQVFRYQGEKEAAFKRLKEIITSLDGMTLREFTGNNLPTFRFNNNIPFGQCA